MSQSSFMAQRWLRCERRCLWARHRSHPAPHFSRPASSRNAAAQRRPRLAPCASAMPEIIPYLPVQKGATYDLRLYEAYTVAETEYVRRDEGFLALGEYMSGGNASGARMRETQPVVMCYFPEGHKRMRVRLSPREEADVGQPLPQPAAGSGVSLEIAGGEVVATLRIEGNVTPEVAAAQRQRLLTALQADGLQLAEAEAGGFFRVAQYGPMNSLTTRVNELWLAVKLG